jgi:hypothetical protein
LRLQHCWSVRLLDTAYDTRLASEKHSALRNAVEFSPFSPSGEINPGLVRVAEHVAR